ncbi:alpha/beta hydrolase [Solimonas soli]|uniref:alpha/beta hydrolase n=1 Tax=Solimonas soli TaxID=413479 RepID=UPI0004B2E09A|nr:alpha/beta hydrolase [Solimonas soli]
MSTAANDALPPAAALDAQIAGLLAAMAHVPQPDYTTLTAAQLRAAMAANPSPFAPGDEVAAISDRTLYGPNGDLRIRLYRPHGDAAALPMTLYFHGGGFVACGLDTHDNICRTLAARAGSLVVSVDYALAPEAPFPAAVEDAQFALDWLDANAASVGADATRLAVAGDSAGGNLAAVLAQLARRNGPQLRHQLLLYPVTDCAGESETYAAFGRGYFLSADAMRWYRRQYVADAKTALDPRASPLRAATVAGVAPATIVTAEFDPLRGEGEAYARKLEGDGVAVACRCWPGQVHGFASMLGVIDAADAALTFAAGQLRIALR